MATDAKRSLWRDEGGPLGYGGALAYSAAAHAAGVALLLRVASSASPLAAVACALLGVALAAHGRVVAAYLVHEASHSSVFKSVAHNTTFGTACLWMCVPPYAPYAAAPRAAAVGSRLRSARCHARPPAPPRRPAAGLRLVMPSARRTAA